MRHIKLIPVILLTFVLTGCSMPFQQKEEIEQAPEVESVVEESVPEAVEMPVDLFEEKDREERARMTPTPTPTPTETPTPTPTPTETPTQTPTPKPTATPTPEPTKTPEEKIKEELAEVKTTKQLEKFLSRKHDNSKFGAAESLADYVGQISLTNAAICISSKTGVEKDAEAKLRLDRRLIRMDFDKAPVEESHEYYDKDGHLLFTIDDVDLTGGVSCGKVKIRVAGSDNALMFYYDDIDIEASQMYCALPEDTKAAIGSRYHKLTKEEKKELEALNNKRYGKTRTVKGFVEERYEKIAHVYNYSPGHPYANEKGYVEIPQTSAFVKSLLTTKYVKKRHAYKLINTKNYVVFEDKEGNWLFTMNTTDKTSGVDLSRKRESISNAYSTGRLLELYPVTVDVKEEIAKEKALLKYEEELELKGVTEIEDSEDINLTDEELEADKKEEDKY